MHLINRIRSCRKQISAKLRTADIFAFLSKVIEKAVVFQINLYLETNKLFPLLQSAYNAFQTIFSFFQNQNSARFYNFDLFKRNHSANKHKFHEKNRKTAYMLRKWALFHASGGISKIQVGLFFPYF